MEGFELVESLGNMGVVPLVIGLTQVIKRRIGDFRYGSDVLALLLSFALCIGWEFYYMAPEAYVVWSSLTGLGFFKWFVSMLGAGIGTWFAASKLYDFGHGNRKREAKHASEKEQLVQEVEQLKNGNGKTEEPPEEDVVLTNRLREILEG